jgi:signal transduction histidine kinase/ActR/RegA family two-component response regulator
MTDQNGGGRQRRATPSTSTAEPDKGRLVILSGQHPGRRFVVDGTVCVGRGSTCDVVVDDPEVSREHLRIELKGNAHWLRDLESRNGTFINGAKIGEARLEMGDEIRLGTTAKLLFTRHDPTEDELLHRQRLETLGRLSAGVAHDFNNMLGAISATASYLGHMKPGEATPTETKDCLLDIMAATDRAAELARRLLAYAKPDSAGRKILDLSELCHEIVQLARRTFPRTIEVVSDVEARLVVDGDPSQLHQALMNLVINARDAIEAKGGGGRIVVRARRGDASEDGRPELRLEVEDDGCGVDPQTRERLFEPFYTTKPRGTGFGLGLSSVAEVIKAHGGRVQFESEVGHGSTFSVWLPGEVLPARHRGRQPTVSARWVGKQGKGRKILVVDDEMVIRRSLRRVLRRVDFEVEEAADGEEGLRTLEQMTAPPDLLVLDLDLPGITGEELLPIVRQRDPSLVVLTISGHALTLRGPVRSDAHLSKPFDSSQFLERVFELLGDIEPLAPSHEITIA